MPEIFLVDYAAGGESTLAAQGGPGWWDVDWTGGDRSLYGCVLWQHQGSVFCEGRLAWYVAGQTAPSGLFATMPAGWCPSAATAIRLYCDQTQPNGYMDTVLNTDGSWVITGTSLFDGRALTVERVTWQLSGSAEVVPPGVSTTPYLLDSVGVAEFQEGTPPLTITAHGTRLHLTGQVIGATLGAENVLNRLPAQYSPLSPGSNNQGVRLGVPCSGPRYNAPDSASFIYWINFSRNGYLYFDGGAGCPTTGTICDFTGLGVRLAGPDLGYIAVGPGRAGTYKLDRRIP